MKQSSDTARDLPDKSDHWRDPRQIFQKRAVDRASTGLVLLMSPSWLPAREYVIRRGTVCD
jgi:hypothetical protein